MVASAHILIGSMPAFEAIPEGPARGGVVVVQEAFGLTTHIESCATRLAAAGWHAVAPAFFHRQGSPILGYEDTDAVRPLLDQLTREGIDEDLGATLEHLAGEGFAARQVGVVGFCMGGSIAFFAASSRALGAAVTFYGGGVEQGRFGLPAMVDQDLRTPWLGLFGDRDRGIPVEQVERLRASVAQAPGPTAIVRYAEAEHGFNCDDRPGVYDSVAATDGWARMLAWFDQHVIPGGPATG